MGYHQIELQEKDEGKTAFSTKHGHWAYKRLPFWDKNSPNNLAKDDEHSNQWVNGITLFCVSGRYSSQWRIIGSA
jgi:hypothetical protein